MKGNWVLLIAGVLALSLSQAAKASDITNSYFSTKMEPATVKITTSSPVVVEKTEVTTSNSELKGNTETTTTTTRVEDKTLSAPVVIEKTLEAPVVLEKEASPPVVIEDRIVKRKHAFGIGIWPIFDFEIM